MISTILACPVHAAEADTARYYGHELASTHGVEAAKNRSDIRINGNYSVTGLDVAAAAGATDRAFDLVFNNIKPRNGSIQIRFTGVEDSSGGATNNTEAFVQAIEIGPDRARKAKERAAWTGHFQGDGVLKQQ